MKAVLFLALGFASKAKYMLPVLLFFKNVRQSFK